jgi:integrase
MHQAFGPLKVELKYSYISPSGTIWFQLPVPVELQDRFGKKSIKESTKTKDIVIAARKIEVLLRKYKTEFAVLSGSPDITSQAMSAMTTALLQKHGLKAGDVTVVAPSSSSRAFNYSAADEAAVLEAEAASAGLDYFLNGLQDKLHAYARGDDLRAELARPEDYLSPVEAAALKALKKANEPTLSDALELHLSIHPQRDDADFVKYQRRAFDGLLAVTGNKAMTAFKRADARAYLEASLLTTKTTTVRRRIGAIAAVFATYIRENDLTTPNPFAVLQIPKEGHDKTVREPFTVLELDKLVSLCKSQNDPMRWILALLAGTGARLAEVVGLPLEDIVLAAPFPHVVLQVHPWRDIKGAKGIRGVKDRVVPLVGPALWAAQQVKANAILEQRFAFPQYTDGVTCKATHASGALNSWMRRQGLPHGCHELRHTMKDLLRDVHCPKDISDAITGHGKKDTGDTYGRGYGSVSLLHVTSEWLAKALKGMAV